MKVGDNLFDGKNWDFEFNWVKIGIVFQEGFNKCSGDWVIRMDLDYFLKQFLDQDSDLKKYPPKNFYNPDQIKKRWMSQLSFKDISFKDLSSFSILPLITILTPNL